MKKTRQEIDEHQHKVTSFMNQVAEEYGRWNGWTTGIGRNHALGEYILEITDDDRLHDPWLDIARKAYLKDKKDRHISMTPPPNLKA